MKVYVIKNEQGQYQTPDMSFISSIWQADLFNDYEVAKCYCKRDCEIIGCELMQVTELANYTKQVRKEVVGDLKEELKKNGKCSIRVNGTMDFFIELEKLNEILDQIQD